MEERIISYSEKMQFLEDSSYCVYWKATLDYKLGIKLHSITPVREMLYRTIVLPQKAVLIPKKSIQIPVNVEFDVHFIQWRFSELFKEFLDKESKKKLCEILFLEEKKK